MMVRTGSVNRINTKAIPRVLDPRRGHRRYIITLNDQHAGTEAETRPSMYSDSDLRSQRCRSSMLVECCPPLCTAHGPMLAADGAGCGTCSPCSTRAVTCVRADTT